MAKITFKGSEIETVGELPAEGTTAPEFTLTRPDLEDVSLSQYKGTRLVLSMFPSIDTPVCEAAAKKFNEHAAGLENVRVLCVSADLPFALKRFCAAEGIENVEVLSEFRQHTFGEDYGVRITSGPLAGLLSRAVLIIDEQGTVRYRQQVPEVTEEPDYAAVLKALG